MIDHAAVASGRTVDLAGLGRPLGVDGETIDRWLTLLEQMFVIRRVRAWHRNDLKRLVKTPKLHFLDSDLLATLRRMTEADIMDDRSKLGVLLEGFVFSELTTLVGRSDDRVTISHLRDRDKVEVDFVLERAGRIVGLETKAAASVKPEDFHGLKRLQEATGKAFACGIILHDAEGEDEPPPANRRSSSTRYPSRAGIDRARPDFPGVDRASGARIDPSA